jgi:hypothetical protein
MRELGERQYALAGASLDGSFADTAQKAQILLPDRLITTAVAELADVAMVIQQHFWRGFSSLQTLGVSEQIFGSR